MRPLVGTRIVHRIDNSVERGVVARLSRPGLMGDFPYDFAFDPEDRRARFTLWSADEGITWARGWYTPAANALRVVAALS